jgi:hypothetical protein
MFQLTLVVIRVGWLCWPCDERWYAGGGEGSIQSKRGMMDVKTQIKVWKSRRRRETRNRNRNKDE